VLIHEAGHFFVARAVGMSPRRFYVGFPPALAKVERNGIEYGVGMIPLGGYVKIPGMHRPAPADVDAQFARPLGEAPHLTPPLERLKRPLEAGDYDRAAVELDDVAGALRSTPLSDEARNAGERAVRDLGDMLGRDAYWRQDTWRKVAVIVAGPAANLVVAIALLATVLVLGVPTGVTRAVERVLPDSPAQTIGLQAGDEIVAVGGRAIEADRIPAEIRASDGEPITVTVRRDGERVTLGPIAPEETDGAYRLGFALEPEMESYGPVHALGVATQQTWEITRLIGQALVGVVSGRDREAVATPVGVVQASSESLELGFRYYLQILALISLSLALLNLLPLLPLDGGHIAFSLAEALRGRAIARSVYERASVVGIAFVLFLFAVGLTNDIGRLSGG
jgi:regulator of sigma E protease